MGHTSYVMPVVLPLVLLVWLVAVFLVLAVVGAGSRLERDDRRRGGRGHLAL